MVKTEINIIKIEMNVDSVQVTDAAERCFLERNNKSLKFAADLALSVDPLDFGGKDDDCTTSNWTHQIHWVSFRKEAKIFDVDCLISFEELNDGSDTTINAADSTSAGSSSALVSGTTIHLKMVPEIEVIVNVQETVAFSKCEKAANAALLNAIHTLSNDSNEEVYELETTMFSRRSVINSTGVR